MTTDQQKLALLEWAGWKTPKHWESCSTETHRVLEKDGDIKTIEEFNLSSLDTIAEFVSKIAVTHGTEWCMEVRKIIRRDANDNPQWSPDGWIKDVYFYNATAPQRLEALVRTLGLWREKSK